MKKRIFILVLTLVLVCSLVSCGGGGSKETLVGAWSPAESSTAPSGFPDSFVLYEDHTGVMEGVRINWSTHENDLTITWLLGSHTLQYELHRSTLTLTKNDVSVEYVKS